MLIKKESITSQKLVFQDFWQIANSVFNKGKSAMPPLFQGMEMLLFTSDNAKLFAKSISNNSDLDDAGISLPVFLPRTNLKLPHVSVIPKMMKKILTKLDLSKESGPHCISVVALKNCELEFS